LTYKNADPVKRDRVIFNIAHNKARLVAIVNFKDRRVVVEKVLIHAEYDRKDCEKL
jgi:mRNA interferase HigB